MQNQESTQPPTNPNPTIHSPLSLAQLIPPSHAQVGHSYRPAAELGHSYRAPAHKHAHHLHSIPPREKSTRTLIIDHMLWVHARTRFAQARAELGMTDRTGGSSCANFAHRERPENYEEEEEELSDGEDLMTLKLRDGSRSAPFEGEQTRRHDFALAKILRSRAESVEKVVTSMIDQPPPVHQTSEDYTTPPTSPATHPSWQKNAVHQHTLPNGVRFRLALATLVNDIFSRQVLRRPYSLPGETVRIAELNQAREKIETLIRIPGLPYDIFRLEKNRTSPRFSEILNTLSDRSKYLYDGGVALDAASLRCARHLSSKCEICNEPKETSFRAGSSSTSLAVIELCAREGSIKNERIGISGWQDGSGVGSGLAGLGSGETVLRRRIDNPRDEREHVHELGTLAEMIPRFIRLSALVASELAAENGAEEEGSSDRTDSGQTGQKGSASPSPSSTPSQSGLLYSLIPTREWYMLLVGLLTRSVLEGYLVAEWTGFGAAYSLLTLGTGLDARQEKKDGSSDQTEQNETDQSELRPFKDLDPDELPSLAVAMKALLPTPPGDLTDGGTGSAIREYHDELRLRLQKILDVPTSTPDLLSHLESLSRQYPGEAVERAAVRFFEAIARWRGKPELETYKKKSFRSQLSDKSGTPGSSSMTMDSLVHSNPASPTSGPSTSNGRTHRMPIDLYFNSPSGLE